MLSGCDTDTPELEYRDGEGLPLVGGNLYVVAHQDDDLLFMSPDIPRSIQRGEYVHVVYMTAGDAGFEDDAYWQGREQGVFDAYALMAELSNSWTPADLSLPGHTVTSFTLDDAKVRLTFLRLPEEGLGQLWDEVEPEITSKDGQNSYARGELIDTLEDIMEHQLPERISVLDPTAYAHGIDHDDHIHSARFMFAARQRNPDGHHFSMHRTYNTRYEKTNVSDAERDDKQAYFDAYRVHDPCVDGGYVDLNGEKKCDETHWENFLLLVDWKEEEGYSHWPEREYSKSAVQGIAGEISGFHHTCLNAKNGSASEGTTVDVSSCSGVAGQRWIVGTDQTVRSELDADMCLTANAPYQDHASVYLSACDDGAGQRFTLLSDGRMLGPEAQCLDIPDGVTTNGTATQLHRCDGVWHQHWTVEWDNIAEYSDGPDDFSDKHVGTDATKARSLGLADVNGDRKVDACIRLSDGVSCALGQANGHFAPYTNWSPEFDDSEWQSHIYGITLDYADINGEEPDETDLDENGEPKMKIYADVCGRGPDGIVCALSHKTGFNPPVLVSADFSDSNGWGETSRAQSVHLADVNGDDKADVCGRRDDGIHCAINAGSGSFGPATLWIEAFTDEDITTVTNAGVFTNYGWSDPKYGSTVMFGDIDGDGDDDVCGRGKNAVWCAKSNGTTGFEEFSRWGYDDDFSDADSGWDEGWHYFGSLRLADVDGDGAADLCGRGYHGVWCAVSQRDNAFDRKRLVGDQQFRNNDGWKYEQSGATIQFADLNGDGHEDACARRHDGLHCVEVP